jgi:uncharacterized membrane-anchored protein YhcB (DUF1043 family)
MSELSAATDESHAASRQETTVLPGQLPDEQGVVAPPPHRRPRWVIPAIALIVGLAVGAAVAGFSVAAAKDPVKSPEYHALQGKLSGAQAEISGARAEASQANSSAAAASSSAAGVAAAASSSAAQRAAELDQREQAVGAREIRDLSCRTARQGDIHF